MEDMARQVRADHESSALESRCPSDLTLAPMR